MFIVYFMCTSSKYILYVKIHKIFNVKCKVNCFNFELFKFYCSICMKLETEHETPLMCPWTMSMELHQYFTEHEVCNPITMSLNNEYGSLSICHWTKSMEPYWYVTEQVVWISISMSLDKECGTHQYDIEQGVWNPINMSLNN